MFWKYGCELSNNHPSLNCLHIDVYIYLFVSYPLFFVWILWLLTMIMYTFKLCNRIPSHGWINCRERITKIHLFGSAPLCWNPTIITCYFILKPMSCTAILILLNYEVQGTVPMDSFTAVFRFCEIVKMNL